MPSHPDQATFSISDLAQEFALTTRTIRFYEDEGLLTPRRAGQARIYGERERVRKPQTLRDLVHRGLPLTDRLLSLLHQRAVRGEMQRWLGIAPDAAGATA